MRRARSSGAAGQAASAVGQAACSAGRSAGDAGCSYGRAAAERAVEDAWDYGSRNIGGVIEQQPLVAGAWTRDRCRARRGAPLAGCRALVDGLAGG
jgi:hypothetical protein